MFTYTAMLYFQQLIVVVVVLGVFSKHNKVCTSNDGGENCNNIYKSQTSIHIFNVPLYIYIYICTGTSKMYTFARASSAAVKINCCWFTDLRNGVWSATTKHANGWMIIIKTFCDHGKTIPAIIIQIKIIWDKF